MILNTGARTDTAQYFSPWLLKRFEQGFVYVRNPMFIDKVTRYDLSPDKIDAVLFCSKNYAPLLPRLAEITSRYRTYFHYTITAYGADVEPGVPDIDTSLETLRRLSRAVGKRRLAWRYDPVLLTQKYTVERHIETFSYMAERIAPYVERCTFSFVEPYKKLTNNMPELVPLTQTDRQKLARRLGETAGRLGLRIQTCGTDVDLKQYGIERSGCTTLDILGRANDCEFAPRAHKGSRPGCGCIETRDIGAYDTCRNGCKYCYANSDPQAAFRNCRFHDPDSPILLGHLEKGDTVRQAEQPSFLRSRARQVSLFD